MFQLLVFLLGLPILGFGLYLMHYFRSAIFMTICIVLYLVWWMSGSGTNHRSSEE